MLKGEMKVFMVLVRNFKFFKDDWHERNKYLRNSFNLELKKYLAELPTLSGSCNKFNFLKIYAFNLNDTILYFIGFCYQT